MTLEIRPLTTDAVDDARRLSTQIGWNQTATDWHRLLELFPDTCYAGYADGTLVATSTLATYGESVGWIGMVLVDEDHRRQGYGSDIFERALEAGRDREIDVIGLDATDAGASVYRQYDFVSVGGIDRWGGVLNAEEATLESGPARLIESVESIARLDAEVTAIDRRLLVNHLLESDDTTAFVTECDGAVTGCAVVRPGRTCPQIGPLVARESSDVAALLSAVADATDESVIVDALREDETAAALDRFGLEVQRRLHRMALEEPTQRLSGDGVVAAIGFEWG